MTLEEAVLSALGFPSGIPDAELAQAVAAQAGLQQPSCQETVDLLVRIVRGIEANLLDIPHPVSHGAAAELVLGPAFAALTDGGFYRVRDDLGHHQVGEVLWWWFGRDVAPALERAGLITLVGIPLTGPVPLEGT